MRTHSRSALVALAFAGVSCAAASADEFNFSYFGDLINGSGSLIGTDNGDGSYDITSGEFYVTEGLMGGSYSLLLNPNGRSPAYSPSGFFIYDNQVYPEAPDKVNWYGLVFMAGSTEINIFREGAEGSYTGYAHGPDGNIIAHGTFELEGVRTGGIGDPDVPAPGAAALVAMSVAMVSRRRRPQ